MSTSWQVWLYVAAVLIPLAAFAVEAIFSRQLKRYNAWVATGAIGLSCVLSLVGFVDYFAFEAPWVSASHHDESQGGESGHEPAAETEAAHHDPLTWSAGVDWVLL